MGTVEFIERAYTAEDLKNIEDYTDFAEIDKVVNCTNTPNTLIKKTILLGTFALLFYEPVETSQLFTAIKKQDYATFEQLNKYDNFLSENIINSIEQKSQIQPETSNFFEKSIDVIAIANDIFKGTTPLDGEPLKYLAELFEKSGTKVPTLPNRL